MSRCVKWNPWEEAKKNLHISTSEANYAVLCKIIVISTKQRRDFETLCPGLAKIYAYEHINVNKRFRLTHVSN